MMTEKCKDVLVLPSETVESFPVRDLKAVIALDGTGNVTLFKPENIKVKELDLSCGEPIETNRIIKITTICIVTDETNPRCSTIKINGAEIRIC